MLLLELWLTFFSMLPQLRRGFLRLILPVKPLRRYVHGTMATRTEPERTAVELKIPVPWGHIAAKDWGPPDGIPLLGLHGWQDNAGTHDRLVHFLPGHRLVSLDLPGHGLSSHYPPGMHYTYFDFFLAVRRAVMHLGWTKYNMIGHSMGGLVAAVYASVYPSEVEKVVMLDTVHPLRREERIPSKLIDTVFAVEKKLERPTPTFTQEDATMRAAENLTGQMSLDSMKILMERGLREAPEGGGRVIFSRDLRLQTIMLYSMSRRQAMQFLSHIKCHLLVVICKNRVGMLPDAQKEDTEFYEMYQKKCSSFQLERVDGTHFVHLDHPEHVGHMVAKFLSNTSSHL